MICRVIGGCLYSIYSVRYGLFFILRINVDQVDKAISHVLELNGSFIRERNLINKRSRLNNLNDYVSMVPNEYP